MIVSGSASSSCSNTYKPRVEIGATIPTRGLFVLEQELDALPDTITTWLAQAGPLLAASVRP